MGDRDDYFGFDEQDKNQIINIPEEAKTNWAGLGDFFAIHGVILSEDAQAPGRLADAYDVVKERFSTTATVVDANALMLQRFWKNSPAQERYFWFAGAEIYALEKWAEGIEKKTKILRTLGTQLVTRQTETKQAYTDFRTEFQAKFPTYKSFPPNREEMAAKDPDLVEDYDLMLDRYTKRVIGVGQQLSDNFTDGAKWLGSAGKVPPKYMGADVATPWRGYGPQGDGTPELAPPPPVPPMPPMPPIPPMPPVPPVPPMPPVPPVPPLPPIPTVPVNPANGGPGLQIPPGLRKGFGPGALLPGQLSSADAAISGRRGMLDPARLLNGMPGGNQPGASLQGRLGAPVLSGPSPADHSFRPASSASGLNSSMSQAMSGMQQQALSGRTAAAAAAAARQGKTPAETSSGLTGRKRLPGRAPAPVVAPEKPAEPKPVLARKTKPTEKPVGRPTLADRLAAG